MTGHRFGSSARSFGRPKTVVPAAPTNASGEGAAFEGVAFSISGLSFGLVVATTSGWGSNLYRHNMLINIAIISAYSRNTSTVLSTSVYGPQTGLFAMRLKEYKC